MPLVDKFVEKGGKIEEVFRGAFLDVIRIKVPGGWIYYGICIDRDRAICSTFVPSNDTVLGHEENNN